MKAPGKHLLELHILQLSLCQHYSRNTTPTAHPQSPDGPLPLATIPAPNTKFRPTDKYSNRRTNKHGVTSPIASMLLLRSLKIGYLVFTQYYLKSKQKPN